jgi:tight adherence protein C
MGITLCLAGFGFLAPNFWLSMAVSKRKTQIRNGLPDALDMLVISVEAGLGLDAALQRVGDEMQFVHPILAEELQLVTLEAQMGIPRSEALGNLARRVSLEEIHGIVGTVNQAERFGTSIGRALRNQSNALRVKRRQAAEERAQKTTVKLMAPLILFIFPAILVVLAGPAALRMLEALKGNSSLL